MKKALTIAGSDCSGGAGIQADLKTFQAFGVFGTSALTAITAQNTLGVSAVHPIPVDVVRAQIDAVADDLPPAAIKTGQLRLCADVWDKERECKGHDAQHKEAGLVPQVDRGTDPNCDLSQAIGHRVEKRPSIRCFIESSCQRTVECIERDASAGCQASPEQISRCDQDRAPYRHCQADDGDNGWGHADLGESCSNGLENGSGLLASLEIKQCGPPSKRKFSTGSDSPTTS